MDKLFSQPQRSYIVRLRHDPRTRAMLDGWVAQATYEAEQRYPDRNDDRQRTHYATQRGIELAMSFVLDNDGELVAVREQLERVLKAHLDLSNLSPRPVVIQTVSTGKDQTDGR